MSKIELPTITSGYNLSTINNNFQKIEDALNKEVLYRKNYVGEPNEMQANLDMNSKEILNVSVGSSPGSLVTKGYVDQEIAEERTYVDQELAKKYDKTGGPVSGNILMQGNRISGLPNGSQPTEPATYAQLLAMETEGDSLLRQDLAATGGASLIGFTAGNPTFFETSTVELTLSGELRFDNFKGNNDDERWANMVAYASTVTSLNVSFSSRTHTFNVSPATITKPFVFVGSGTRNTIFQFNDCDGIRFDMSGYGKYCQCKITGVAIVANSVNSKTGIYFKGFQTFSPHDSSLILDGVSIYGIRELDNIAPIGSEWAIGLHLDNTDEVSIRDTFISGSQLNISYATRTTSKGIFADTVTGLRISASSIFMCHEGIEVINQSEGMIFDGLTVVAVDTGILLRDLVNPANNHIITNTHVSAYTKGIEIRKLGVVSDHAIAVFISNVFLLEREGNASKPLYTALEAYVTRSSLDSITIQSNNITSPNRRGIVLPNQDITVSDVSAVNVGTLLYIDPVAASYVYYNNVRTRGDLTAEIGGSSQFAVGAGLGSTAGAAEYTLRCDTFRTTDLLGRSQYESSGSRHMFGGGRQNASIFHDFRTFAGGTAAYDARISFTGGNSTVDGKADMTILSGSVGFDGNISPRIANGVSCGTSAKPWSGGFTQTAFTITSDEREKTAPLKITDAMLDAMEEVDWVQYQYIDRVEAKGPDGARWHFGAVAQRFVEAFARNGLDAHDYGFLCYDEWEASPEIVVTTPAILDECGEIIEPEHTDVIQAAREAGNHYGIRYEEILVLEAALQRRNYQRLLSRIKALEMTNG